MSKTIGYLRVSTTDQDTEKFKSDILKFANDRDMGRVEFVSEKVSGVVSWKKRALAQVVEDLKPGDRLITPELSRLGRSLPDVLNLLKVLTEGDVAVFSVKEGFQLNGTDMQSKVMRTMIGLFAELEHDFISIRTQEGLAATRAKGTRLGRPRGPGKSKLDEHREEIIALLKTRSQKTYIAKKYGVTPGTLHHWLKQRKLDNIEEEF